MPRNLGGRLPGQTWTRSSADCDLSQMRLVGRTSRPARRRQAVPRSAARGHLSARLIGASVAALLLVAAVGVASGLPLLVMRPSPEPAADQAFADLPTPLPTENPTPAAAPTAEPTAAGPTAVSTAAAPTAVSTAAAPTAKPTAAAGPPRGAVALTFDAGADRGYAQD